MTKHTSFNTRLFLCRKRTLLLYAEQTGSSFPVRYKRSTPARSSVYYIQKGEGQTCHFLDSSLCVLNPRLKLRLLEHPLALTNAALQIFFALQVTTLKWCQNLLYRSLGQKAHVSSHTALLGVPVATAQ